jgi:hypothetical protein
MAHRRCGTFHFTTHKDENIMSHNRTEHLDFTDFRIPEVQT